MFTDRIRIAFALVLATCSCGSPDESAEESVTVGLLLPFTGSASATASNLERATLYAVDRINAAGGVRGKHVRVVSRDTHSDVARALAAAEELAAEGAVAVIGAESAEVAEAVNPWLAEHNVLFISPFVGAASEPGSTCDAPWVRLAPSAKALGEALAKQAIADGVDTVAVVYSSAAYDQALKNAVTQRFVSLGGKVAQELRIDAIAQSYAAEVTRAIDAGVTAIVLATSPRAGALFVNEFYASSSKRPKWFLSPLLKTDLLLQNVAPAALEGARGVAPKIYDLGPKFPRAFSKRWQGDSPLEGAYFYFDAMALLAGALAQNTEELIPGAAKSYETLIAGVFSVAFTRGETMTWDELESGITALNKGRDVYYTGLTGPVALEACGSRRLGLSSTWTVRDGAIVND